MLCIINWSHSPIIHQMQIIFKGKDKGHMLCMANEHTNQNFRCFVRKTSRVLQHWEFCYNHTCNNSKIKLVILALNVHPWSSIIQWPRLAWIQKVVYLLFIFFILYSNSKFKYIKKKKKTLILIFGSICKLF